MQDLTLLPRIRNGGLGTRTIPDPILKIREHMKGNMMTSGDKPPSVVVISLLSSASAILGQIGKVPCLRPGHRPAGQERKDIPFEMALLAG